MWVDATEGESELASLAEEALASGKLIVAVDAEWHDTRPVSLLQLAVETDPKTPPTVFLVDMVKQPSETTLMWCRRLLFPESHRVLAFSRHEDIRRLQRVGLLPPEDPGWIDLQDRFGPGGAPPGLQAVVAGTLGRWMDKSLQTSDWDVRPLSPEQKAYAALDASVLLRLHRCEVPLAPSWQVKPETAKQPAEVTMDAVKERWLQYRAQPTRLRRRLVEGGAREKNSDLCFILPAALTRLMRKMRGLGLDTEILREGAPQGDLVESAEADDRIILYYQAKKLLPARVSHRTYVLQSSAPDEQLREVIEAFDVDVDSDCLCGRCVQCNAWDWNLVGRDAVRGNPQVAEKTLENFDEFWLCGGCGKIYWEGKMFVKALGHFRGFMPDAKADGTEGAAPQTTDKEQGQVAQRSQELESLGWSATRVRAAMVREGLLSPDGALEMDGDDRKVESASGYASGSGHRLRASACRSPSSRPLVSMLMVFAAFAGHQQIRVFPRAGAADVRPTKPIFQMRSLAIDKENGCITGACIFSNLFG